MIGWQITKDGKTERINKVEMLDGLDSVKVKITHTLITGEDIALLAGEGKAVDFPIIPGRMAVGQITELASESPYLTKGMKVCISAVKACGDCHNCANGNRDKCYDFKVAGQNTDGFLKDFAVLKTSDVHQLPQSVNEKDAVYLEYVSLALSVIDKLKIEKGQHVAILGSSIFGSVLAQLIIYYQGVPILIDEDDEGLLLAKKSGVYYTIKSGIKTEKEIAAITGGRMVGKVVYVCDSDLPVDLAFKLAAPFGTVSFAGFSYPNVKALMTTALKKQLEIVCITGNYGNTDTAINILANKAVDFTNYKLPLTKMEDIEKNLADMFEKYKNKQHIGGLLINMLG